MPAAVGAGPDKIGDDLQGIHKHGLKGWELPPANILPACPLAEAAVKLHVVHQDQP